MAGTNYDVADRLLAAIEPAEVVLEHPAQGDHQTVALVAVGRGLLAVVDSLDALAGVLVSQAIDVRVVT